MIQSILKWLFGWLIEPGYSLLACFAAALLASFLGVWFFDSFIPKNKTLKNNWFGVTVLCISLMTITFLLMSSCVSGKGGGAELPENDKKDSKPEQVDKTADNKVPADNNDSNVTEKPVPPTKDVVPQTPSEPSRDDDDDWEDDAPPVKDRIDFTISRLDGKFDFILTTKKDGQESGKQFFRPGPAVAARVVAAIKDLSDKNPNAEIHITLEGLTEQNRSDLEELIKEQSSSIRNANITEKDNQ
ncbi:MAG: hypothetical protein LBU65_16945 [Planctomycetaceae bacterium]|jgi:hypothetical protein|nr:hypothetical protein [Planctomycetaceae bacterium]